LATRFCNDLADEGGTPDSLRRSIDLLLHPEILASSGHRDDDQIPSTSPSKSVLSLLMTAEHFLLSQIV
jgi:hypothetical protein